jgi:hypothetical protein
MVNMVWICLFWAVGERVKDEGEWGVSMAANDGN